MEVPGRVSVLIPCYNHGRYLGNSVGSVLRQTYDNWEVIIVDDGSSDCTQQIGEMLAALYSKVRYFRRENQGVAASRNFAAEQATGEFLYPLDADDELVPTAVQNLMNAVEKVPNCHFAFGCLEYFDTLPGEHSQWIPGPVLGVDSQLYSTSLPGTSLLKRSLFAENGVRYREMFAEDWDLWLQVFDCKGQGAYVPEVVLRYRQSRDSRDADNKYFHYQTLAQLVRNNPGRYPDPFQSFASAVLWQECAGYKPSYVFLPHEQSAEFLQGQGRYRALFDEINRRGRLVTTIGQFPQAPNEPGRLFLNRNSEAGAEALVDPLLKLGSELIVFSELGPEVNLRLRTLPNLKTLVDLGLRPDTLAHCRLQYEEGSYQFSSEGQLWQLSPVQSIDRLEQEHAQRAQAVKDKERTRRRTLLKLASRSYSAAGYNYHAAPEERLTVIVPSRNLQADRIERCLQSIRECESPKNVEVIVSDFGSTQDRVNELERMAKTYQITLISSPTRSNWSRSRVLNIGIRNASTPWVFMTDADMLFHPELIPMWREYCKVMGDSYMYVAQCKKLPPIPKLPFPWTADCYDSISALGRIYDTYGQGGCTILPTEWLHKVRGLNESYEIWGAEDNDLSFRAELDGLEMIWMKPGRLLHQWHIKAVSNAVQEKNRDAFLELKVHPRLVTNDETWGMVTTEEAEEYYRLGPKPYEPGEDFSLALEREQQMLDSGCSQSERIQLLAEWGVNALNENHVETALETFEDVLSMDPNNTAALLGLATHQLVYEQYRKAMHYVQRILQIDSGHEKAAAIARYIDSLNLDIA